MQQGDIPLINVPMGPGSQSDSEDDMVLDYMPMPSEMDTYDVPVMPEAEEVAACPETIKLLDDLQQALAVYKVGEPTQIMELKELSAGGVELINQILGEGEVSLVVNAGEQTIKGQETVLAGVWRLLYSNAAGEVEKELLEVADVPSIVNQQAFRNSFPLAVDEQQWPAGVLNAPPVLVELQHKSAGYQLGNEPHVINLTLLPFSPADHDLLNKQLGSGDVVILSRGYGNCRISSTLSDYIWRVQYFNSTDQLILDTLEVESIPAVACAAQEDLDDSAERLHEIRDILV